MNGLILSVIPDIHAYAHSDTCMHTCALVGSAAVNRAVSVLVPGFLQFPAYESGHAQEFSFEEQERRE
ncbi:unnamed protein product [Leuciscus chuanchicus]